MIGVLTALLVLMIVVGAATGLVMLVRALVLALAEPPARGPLFAAPSGYEASQTAGEVLRQTFAKAAHSILRRG